MLTKCFCFSLRNCLIWISFIPIIAVRSSSFFTWHVKAAPFHNLLPLVAICLLILATCLMAVYARQYPDYHTNNNIILCTTLWGAISISQLGKLSHKEVKWLAQWYTAYIWRSLRSLSYPLCHAAAQCCHNPCVTPGVQLSFVPPLPAVLCSD